MGDTKTARRIAMLREVKLQLEAQLARVQKERDDALARVKELEERIKHAYELNNEIDDLRAQLSLIKRAFNL